MTPQNISESDNRTPRHVAIIMDGNGRWASRNGQPRIFGHQKGVDVARSIIEAAGEFGLKTLTLYTFSEENWGRPEEEVQGIMGLLDHYVLCERDNLKKKNVRLHIIGRLEALPAKTRENLLETREMLSKSTGLNLVIALSYGARQEIAMAAQTLASDVLAGKMRVADINPEVFSSRLWTAEMDDPDLLIRTSGEMRISNFLLWQMAYTEFWFTEKAWPDFTKEDFYSALEHFSSRKRRYGLVDEVRAC